MASKAAPPVFTDWYGQQSCTAGRAAFITGQSPIRTGLTKVGLPGTPEGMKAEDPTIATLLKPLGYATGQFGKNHLGDRDEMLPTVHGFDEFLGNLYHLNAEEEPENLDYPKDPEFKKKFGPRGVIHSWAMEDGTQKIEDTGPLTKKRMETVDEEVTKAALAFIDKAHKDGKPFFVWWNSTRMHIFTHLKPESEGKTGLGIYADGMAEHDAMVGQLLDKLKELGIEDDTIVMYSTDNGAETFTWPDGGTTMFRGEKNTNWEGGYRVPSLIRWPGTIKPGTVVNDVSAHEDMLPTLLAAAGNPDVVAELLKGKTIGDRTYKVHLDGYDLAPALKGGGEWPRKEFIYWTDDGNVAALRYNNLEDHLPGAEGGRPARVAGAVRRAPRAVPDQFAHGSLRACQAGRCDGLSALVYGAHVRHRAGGRLCRAVAAKLQGVPAAPKAWQLQSQPRHGGGDGASQLVAPDSPARFELASDLLNSTRSRRVLFFLMAGGLSRNDGDDGAGLPSPRERGSGRLARLKLKRRGRDFDHGGDDLEDRRFRGLELLAVHRPVGLALGGADQVAIGPRRIRWAKSSCFRR